MATRKRRTRRKKERFKRKMKFISIILGILFIGSGCIYINRHSISKKKMGGIQLNSDKEKINKNLTKEPSNKGEIIITAGGDCTFGTDKKLRESTSFPIVMDKLHNKYEKVLEGIKDVTDKDDFTIVNFDGVLTDRELEENKGSKNSYYFKGKSEYAKILKEGSIEGVNLENSHSFDYGEEGSNDTLKALEENGINYFDEENNLITEIKGIKFGFLGYNALENKGNLQERIREDIKRMKEDGGEIVIVYFQWGGRR